MGRLYQEIASALILTYNFTVSSLLDSVERGIHPLVLHLMAHSFGGPPGGGEIFDRLVARGVPAIRISRGDNLTNLLTRFLQEQRILSSNLAQHSIFWKGDV